MTPHHLHATAAAHALAAVLPTLIKAADREATADLTNDGLRSPTWGGTRSVGTHSDPIGALAVLSAPARSLAHDLALVNQTLAYVTLTAPAGTGPALGRIIAAIPGLLPGTAAVVAQHLWGEDKRARTALRVAPAGVPLPGECPAVRCRKRELRAHVDGPVEVWTVACTCRCVGVGCGCGMQGAVEGVGHIWPRAQVLSAIERTAA